MAYSEEMRERIKQAWLKFSSAKEVARATGASPRSVTRYRPQHVVQRHPRALTPEKKQQIVEAWRTCKTAEQVARLCGVSAHTACAYRPLDIAAVQMGYSTWSEEARKRWDDWWSSDGKLNRVDIIENWNRQWLRDGRGGQ
jgi:hypothetical protein